MKRAALILILFFAAIGSAFGQSSGSSKVDPYILNPPVIAGTFNLVNNQTSLTSLSAIQAPDLTKRNLLLIGDGQSNMADSPQASTYVATNAAVIRQININDGGIYAAIDPLLGTSINNYPSLGGGNPLLRIADAEITAGNFDAALVASIAIDGSAIADHDPALNGVLATRFPVLFARLAAKGWVQGANITVVVLWGQGETDTTNGTTQTAYFNSLTNIINASRVAAGYNVMWLIAEQTYNTGTVSSAVQAAQLAIVNHSSNIWAGPNADVIIGTNCGGTCRPDNLHFGNLGMPVYVGNSQGWQAALHATGPPF